MTSLGKFTPVPVDATDSDEILSKDPAIIAQQLFSRSQRDKPFTRIGNRVMVSVRPSRGLALCSNESSKEYAQQAKEVTKPNQVATLPHVFHISASAYIHALRGKMDQSIVLLGESGSGKSEVYRMLLRNLCDLSKTSHKKSKTHSQLLKVDSVLSAFGNATTPLNADASCFAQYREIQFDSRGKMVGMKLIEYLLEKSRASGPLDGGKAFHIFYYLLEGATNEERVQWHLSDPAHFAFLNGSTMVGFAQGKGADPLEDLRSNLKSLGIGRRQQAQLWQILSAILHLGNIQFQDALTEKETCSIRNFPQLQLVAEMLGVSASALQMILTSRTRIIGRDNVASYLNTSDASHQRDCFARALYQVMFGWIVEQINQKMCAPDTIWSNCVSILEIPGFGGLDTPGNSFYRLMVNYANERLFSHSMNELFVAPKDAFTSQEVDFPATFGSNKEILAVLCGPRDGILPMIDTEAVKVAPTVVAPQVYEKHLPSGVLVTASSKNMSHSFGIHHYGGIVDYDSRGFAAIDSDILQTDFVTLVRGNPESPGTTNAFLRSLFSDKLIATRKAGDQSTVVAASARGRTPSLRRKQPKQDDDELLDPTATMGHLFRSQFNGLLDTLGSSQPWFIYCIKPFEGSTGKANTDTIKRQVDAYDFISMIGNPATIYTATYPFAEFVTRYKPIVSLWDRDPKTACEAMVRYKNWKPRDCVIGTSALFLAEPNWVDLELKLKEKEDAELAKSQPRTSISTSRDDNDFKTNFQKKYAESVDGSEFSDETASHYESEFDFGGDRINGNVDIEMGKLPKSKLAEEIKPKPNIPPPAPRVTTPLRKRWLCCTWASTWCFLPSCLSCCGGMKQRERQLAWREKFALCVIIFFMNAMVLFLIIGTGYLICPKDPRFPSQSPGEISGRFEVDKNAAVYMYGDYYVIPSIVKSHVVAYMDQVSASPEYFRSEVLGRDVTWMFPIQNNAAQSKCRMAVPPQFRIAPDQPPTTKWVQHGTGTVSALQIFESLKPYRGGPIVVGIDYLTEIVQKNPQTKRYIILNDVVYDLSPLYDISLNPSQKDSWFLGTFFKEMADFYTRGGQIADGTAGFNQLRRQNPEQYTRVKDCLDFMFKIGMVDRRNDLECLIANYILLGASVILVSVIGFKFLAALQFPGKKTPEDHDKFVICQVPCYTEGETSLHRTIDSLTNLRYDDKHKLLFIICDGMIIGSGNDRPTPRIVLDILGVDPAVDPESHAYQSLGDGNQQLNYGKVYSGLYELNGHVVPYIVVVKVGKPSERGRPGNRGKRDSQLVLMRFLMRVHFNQAMSPLELEIYHHMKNIIGVDPSFYEYVFMVDADTQVHEDSLNHLVSHMTRDAKIAGTCGETSIANDRKSFTSMIQVYEYFISHHLAKAFESLFGSVTCLPGCFCMYRIRTPYKNIPVLIAPGLVADYSENTVDTLHLKNLLHLGEDRYLTTLTMKHFPNMKTTFCPDAMCQTYAPDTWSVLLSQRRRWINSTVHNLFELLRLGELCGFCCLSMRFVVFIDLLATFIQPASLVYVGYLVYLAASDNLKNVPVISLILISAVYGFQVIIFLLKTQWQHIGWMIFYLIAIPLFGFYIPVYSFWHFDDFSWGNTRRVIETQGGTVAAQPEQDYFDPASVPLVKWSDYEASRKDSSSNSDTKSKMSYATGYGYSTSIAPSNYSESVVGSSLGLQSESYTVPAGFPTDQELLQEIRHILSTTDLMKITKKSVRDQLSRLFGVDVTPRKEYIHYCIDGILKGEM